MLFRSLLTNLLELLFPEIPITLNTSKKKYFQNLFCIELNRVSIVDPLKLAKSYFLPRFHWILEHREKNLQYYSDLLRHERSIVINTIFDKADSSKIIYHPVYLVNIIPEEYIYVCMYLYMYVCIYIYICIYITACIYIIVCIYVYIYYYLCISIYITVCIYRCTLLYVYIHLYVYVYYYMYIYYCVHIYKCKHLRMYLCIYMCMYLYIYIYICMYVCMYVYQVGSKEDNTKTCVTSKIALVLDNKRRQHSNISLKH